MNKFYVLIDNDPLIQMSWQLAAEKAQVRLATFTTVDEALEFLVNSDVPEKIFIDSELDNNLRGEIEAQKLYDAGFEQLYLATGRDIPKTELPHYIKDIYSKRSPF